MLASTLFISLLINYAVAIDFCCEGTKADVGATSTTGGETVMFYQCPLDSNTRCLKFRDPLSGTTSYGCGTESSCTPGVECCTTETCNCPPNVHKTEDQIRDTAGEMRSIMYPILGIIIAIGWVVAAFLLPKLPLHIILIVLGCVDGFFGIMLIFLPASVYTGLYFAALGAFLIAVAMHAKDNVFGLLSICAMSLLGFFIAGGILSLWSNGASTFENIAASISNCENSMHIQDRNNLYFQVDTRCENWLLFSLFCAFILFLIQPLAIMAAFFSSSKSSGGGSRPQKSDRQVPMESVNTNNNQPEQATNQ